MSLPRTVSCQAPVGTGRCEFTGTPAELAEHATDAGHPLCETCPRSLGRCETRVCERCQRQVRDNLTLIVDAFAMLEPVALNAGYHTSGIPGGDALVILAPGRASGGGPDDHIKFNDPIPAIGALLEIAIDWADQGAPGWLPVRHPTVITVAAYLTRNLHWAAETHDDFDATARDVRHLATQIARVTSMADDPVRAPAQCFDCGGQLHRTYRPLTMPVERRLLNAKGRINASATRRKHPAPVIKRREMVAGAVRGKTREGLMDVLHCARCGTEYTWAQYAMALRERAGGARGWVTVKLASEVGRVTEKQIRNWIERLLVSSRCDVKTHRVEVAWDDVHDRAKRDRVKRQEARERRAC